MIVAICLNPSFDKTAEVPAMRVGSVNRLQSVRQDVGGKGVNVAVVARRLGASVRLLGCAGQDGIGAVEAALDAEMVSHALLPLPGRVRTNIKVVSGEGVTELNEPGPWMDEEAQEAFMRLARENTAPGDLVALCGSLPPGCPADFYARLMRELPERRYILDASGEAFLQGLKEQPYLVKPNRQELEGLVRHPLEGLESVISAAQCLRKQGVAHVIVSLGGDGAVYVGQGHDGPLYAPVIPVPVHSTVGAGDAMVGGLLAAFSKSEDIRSALREGVAAGTASVMTEGTQLIQASVQRALLERVKLQEVDNRAVSQASGGADGWGD